MEARIPLPSEVVASKPDVINTRTFYLTPVRHAAQNRDIDYLNACTEQDYLFSWPDHYTHKTLLEQLGEEGDVDTIHFLNEHYDCDLGDAVKGAAAANHPIELILYIGDLNEYAAYAFEGAAKGRHRQLLNTLSSFVDNQLEDYAADIVRGAAEAGDTETVKFYRDLFSHKPQLKLHHAYITGAALGGHADLVETALKECRDEVQTSLRRYGWLGNRRDYYYAIAAAAQRGDRGLVAKIFTFFYCYPLADIKKLYESALVIAAQYCQIDVMMDILQMQEMCHEWLEIDSVKNKALIACLTKQRFEAAKVLYQTNDYKNEMSSCVPFLEEEFSHMFQVFADAELCYCIAATYDRFHDASLMMPIMKKVYGLTAYDDAALAGYFKSPELKTWLENRAAITQQYHLPKDVFTLIGSYLTKPSKKNRRKFSR